MVCPYRRQHHFLRLSHPHLWKGLGLPNREVLGIVRRYIAVSISAYCAHDLIYHIMTSLLYQGINYLLMSLSHLYIIARLRRRPALIKIHAISPRLLVLHHLEVIRRQPERLQDAITELENRTLQISTGINSNHRKSVRIYLF